MSHDASTPIRVLLVEDDEEDAMIARKLLKAIGGLRFDIVWVSSLAEGLAAVDRDIDAVLLDLSLPDSLGWETFTRMRGGAGNVPIILLTGAVDESLGMAAVRDGAGDYLTKGTFDSASLGRTIRYTIERRKNSETLERTVAALRARNREMAEDLAMAREMQEALLPRHYPAFPPTSPAAASALRFAHAYRPSQFVSGDFFAILPVGDLVAGILICDVMGHGVRSSLVTAIIRGLMQEMKPRMSDPERLLAELNNGLCDVLSGERQMLYASATYLTVDVSSGAVRWASAGHPPPITCRAGETCRLDQDAPEAPADPVLGVLPSLSYRPHVHPITAGDRIFLYTDGILEAVNGAGQLYGHDRLVATLQAARDGSVAEAVDAVMTDLIQFTERDVWEDDVCLLGIEVARLVTSAEGARRGAGRGGG